MFDADGTPLRVTLAERVQPAPYTVLGWDVADADAAVSELSQPGVEPLPLPGMTQDESGVWDAPSGARVAWFHDPSGNVLSLSQLGGGHDPRTPLGGDRPGRSGAAAGHRSAPDLELVASARHRRLGSR